MWFTLWESLAQREYIVTPLTQICQFTLRMVQFMKEQTLTSLLMNIAAH